MDKFSFLPDELEKEQPIQINPDEFVNIPFPSETTEAVDTTSIDSIETHMASLPEVQKAFVLQYLAPELVELVSLITGEQAYKEYFGELVNPNLMLVPQQIQPEQRISAPAGTPTPSEVESASEATSSMTGTPNLQTESTL